jgi:hypothetical protein
MSALDHGMLNVPLSKRGRSLDAQIDDWKRDEAKRHREERKVEHAARLARREAEKERPKFTADDVRGSAAVRDEFGWHRVVRVSKKSVTVETPYSWTERIALDRVLEVRS